MVEELSYHRVRLHPGMVEEIKVFIPLAAVVQAQSPAA